MQQPVILSAVRTPIGKFMGGLSPLSATELGAKVVAEVVRRAGIEPKLVDEAIMGNVVQAGLGQNPARQAALRGGLDPRVAAMTINKVCGSGLKAVGAGGASGDAGRIGNGGGGRDGVDVELPVSAEGRADGLPAGQPGNLRFDDRGWLVGRVRKLSHGPDRRNSSPKNTEFRGRSRISLR